MRENDAKTIEIGSGTIVRTILFVLLFFGLYYLRDLVLVVLTSIVIASFMDSASRRLMLFKLTRTS